jgi:drug/metabolite transporter (DMT)-like permease
MVACLPFGASLVHSLREAPASSIGWVAYLGAGPLALGFLAWAFALRSTSAGRLGSTTYLVPPLAIGMGWVLLGEVPPGLAFAGGALCLGGVALARR